MNNLKQKIENFAPSDLKDWLDRTLQVVEIVPKATPDESPHFAVLDLDRHLDKTARSDLRVAAEALLNDHAESLEQMDPEYARSLLNLADGLDLDSLDRVLADGATRFSQNTLTLPLRRFMLNLLQPRSGAPHFEFWEQLLRDEPDLGGPCITAMLKERPVAALEALPDLPDDPILADGVATQLESAFRLLQGETRETFLGRIRALQNYLLPQLAGTVQEWLNEHEGSAHSSFEKLDQALREVFDDYNPNPQNARLERLVPA